MNETDKLYYTEMLKKGRMVPFVINGKLAGFITFYIGITNEENKFLIRDNYWSVENDNSDGDVCIIDQCWTDKNNRNTRLSYEAWKRFKKYIKYNFPKVKRLYWRRYHRKTGIVKQFKKDL